MAVGVEHRVNKPASRSDHALLLPSTISNAMSYHPKNHTSGMGLSAVDTTSTQTSSADQSDFNDSSFPSQDTDPSPQQHLKQKRRASKSKGPAPIRRSTSTPHMRNLALGASGELSPTTGDKRRNKLGYHRTSVACGHCRRRKIRCLLAPDDPQGRCANCIRLKKECNFYPVEHNPETQRSQTGAVKETSTGALTNSATSSPRHPPPASAEKAEEFRPPFPGTPSGTMSSRFAVQSDMDIDPHHVPTTSGMPVQQPSYPFPPPIETQWPPTAGFLPSSSITESPSSSTSYWRPSPSTANSVYGSESNVSGAHTPAAMSTSSTMSYGPPDSHHWAGQPPFSTPVRSMSYGNIEGLQQQYPNHQGLGIQQNEYSRRHSPYPYPTTIDTNPSTIHPTTSGAFTSGPLSAPIVPNQSYNYPPTWNQYGAVQNSGPEMPMSARSMSAQWYSESGHFDQVPEEGPHPVPYGQNGMQPFYSGA